MSIERKTGLFYELMIRGRWNPAEGNLGEITTYQLQTGSALVDTDSNTLAAPYAPDPPKDLTKEQAVTFLDKKFADFIGQLGDAQKNISDLQTSAHLEKVRTDEAAEIAVQTIAERDLVIVGLNKEIEVAQARIKELEDTAASSNIAKPQS